MGLFGFGLFEIDGAFMGIAVGVSLFLGLSIGAVELLALMYGASQAGVTAGLLRTVGGLDRASGRSQCVPRVLVFQNPSPQIWMIRGLFRRNPTLLLSQGLISLLSERELHSLMSQNIKNFSQRRCGLLGYHFILLHGFLGLLPKSWVGILLSHRPLNESEEAFLTPSSALRLWVCLPALQALIAIVLRFNSKVFSSDFDPEYRAAFQKLALSTRIWKPSLDLKTQLGTLVILSQSI